MSLPGGLLPAGRTQETTKERRPGGVLTRCLNHFNWPFSTQRSSGSTPSSLRIRAPMLLHAEKRQLRWFGPPGRLPVQEMCPRNVSDAP